MAGRFTYSTLIMALSAIAILMMFTTEIVLAQTEEPYHILIKKTESPITVDGILNEAAWQVADVADNFHRVAG